LNNFLRFRLVLFVWCLCAALGPLQPAQAILEEEQWMLKTYFRDPGLWPPEKRDPMERYAKARIDTQPQLVQLYPDDGGRVLREYWLASGDMWTAQQAHQIRDAIMNRRAPSFQQYLRMDTLIYVYPDRSQVTYRFVRGKVYSILAVSAEWEPGDFGAQPPAYWENAKVIRPEKVKLLHRLYNQHGELK